MSIDAELHADALPTYLTTFVGRRREAVDLDGLLAAQQVTTITGMGGAGKTRLAVEGAKRWRSRRSGRRVFWVGLAGVVDAAEVAPTLAAGLGIGGGASELVGEMSAALSGVPTLLVLDNCEQVAASCRSLLELLLPRCLGLVVLTTSQLPLGLAGEGVYALPPLGGPGRHGSRRRSDATDLFVDRARLLVPDYRLTPANSDAIATLCERLAGLPLAIELVASWIEVLSPGDLVRELDRGVPEPHRVLAVDARHRDLDAVLARSWELLSPADRQGLARLSVFDDGFTREAAETVAETGLDALAALTRRSLIQRIPAASGGSRYLMHSLVHRYARSRLENHTMWRGRHLDYFLTLVATAGDSARRTPVEPGPGHPLGPEQANLDVALRWAIDIGDADKAIGMAGASNAFWATSAPVPRSVRRARLVRALALPWSGRSGSTVTARAEALQTLGYLQTDTDRTSARESFRRSEELFRRIDDQVGVAACLRAYGDLALAEGDPITSRRHATASLALCRAVGDEQGAAWSRFDLGQAALAAGETTAAAAHLIAVERRFDELGAPFGACWARTLMSEVDRREGRWADALAGYRSTLHRILDLRFIWLTAELIEGVALTAVDLQRGLVAAELCGAADVWRRAQERIRPAYNHKAFSRTVAVGRKQLGPGPWSTAYAHGRTLTVEPMLRLAEDTIDELSSLVATTVRGLSARELEVLTLVADGLGNAVIAQRLGLSVRTVHAHLRSIFTKLEVSTRTAAVRQGIRLHLLPAVT